MKKSRVGSISIFEEKVMRGYPMIRLILCEDDSRFQEEIRNRLVRIFEQIDLKLKLHCYTDPTLISDQFLSSCDIAILDIDLNHPKYNGMDIARKIRNFRKNTVIIFLTHFIEYAPAGYEVQAYRYILKSQMETELERVIIQAVDQFYELKETLKIQISGEVIDLLLENIRYLDVMQHDITIHYDQTLGGKTKKTYVVRSSLSSFEEHLETQGFLRIHKSYLVNMRYIKKLKCREAELYTGEVLRVSEKSYSELKKKYLLWKGW